MPVDIIADENINYTIIKNLRENGFSILSIMESYSGITDKEVLAISLENNAILLTEDKDFGDLIFSYKHKTIGVIFLRYLSFDVDIIIDKLLFVLKQ